MIRRFGQVVNEPQGWSPEKYMREEQIRNFNKPSVKIKKLPIAPKDVDVFNRDLAPTFIRNYNFKTKARKLEIHWPIHLIATDEDMTFYANNEPIKLSEETGFWDGSTVFIWSEGINSLKKMGILGHEALEWFLESKLKFPHRVAHLAANILEKVITAGSAEQVW